MTVGSRMNRRTFIKTGSAAGLSLTALSFAPEVLGAQVNALADLPGDFELNEATIRDLQEKMRTGTYTSVSITRNTSTGSGPSIKPVPS